MKKQTKNKSKKAFAGSKERVLGFKEGLLGSKQKLLGSKKRLLGSKQKLVGSKKRLLGFKQELLGSKKALLGSKKGFLGTKEAFPESENLFLLIILLAQLDVDYIPGPDGEFDEWQKNFVKHLSSQWPPAEASPSPSPSAAPSELLYQFLGIPEERYDELTEMQKKWDKDYARGGKETDRRSSEAKAKQQTRKDYEALLRSVAGEYIHKNRKASVEIKRALKLTVPDTELSPAHGSHLVTGAPTVALKNMGGGKIDVHFRRSTDQTRPSMPKGYQAELRYVIEIPLPEDPEEILSKTTVTSSRARFQVDAGMTNKKKTLRSYARWKHKINSAFNSPWTTVMEIDIA